MSEKEARLEAAAETAQPPAQSPVPPAQPAEPAQSPAQPAQPAQPEEPELQQPQHWTERPLPEEVDTALDMPAMTKAHSCFLRPPPLLLLMLLCTQDDLDSALGEDAASSTASISSSILQYRTINGRTYHSDRGSNQYW